MAAKRARVRHIKGHLPRKGKVAHRPPDIEKLMETIHAVSEEIDPNDEAGVVGAVDTLALGEFSDDKEVEDALEEITQGLEILHHDLSVQLVKVKKVQDEFLKHQNAIDGFYTADLVECPHCNTKFNKDLV